MSTNGWLAIIAVLLAVVAFGPESLLLIAGIGVVWFVAAKLGETVNRRSR